MTAMETCDGCGFEWDAIQRNEIAGRLVAGAEGFAAVLAGGRASLYQRSTPETWSVVEYAAHARDCMLNLRDRIICGVAEDNPTPKAMYAAVRIATGVYAVESATHLPNEMAVAAALLSRTVDALTPELLARPIFYPWPIPTTRTLLWVAAQALHELEHHLADVVEISQLGPDGIDA
jgi:hypothetical protein